MRPRRGEKPTLGGVLAAVQPGRNVRLYLDLEQKRTLHDPDGRLACQVLRALVQAREVAVAPNRPREPFPLTEHTFQAVAAKLGHPVGIKRSRKLIRRLQAVGVMTRSDSYRQTYRHAPGKMAEGIEGGFTAPPQETTFEVHKQATS